MLMFDLEGFFEMLVGVIVEEQCRETLQSKSARESTCGAVHMMLKTIQTRVVVPGSNTILGTREDANIDKANDTYAKDQFESVSI